MRWPSQLNFLLAGTPAITKHYGPLLGRKVEASDVQGWFEVQIPRTAPTHKREKAIAVTTLCGTKQYIL